MSEEDFTKIVVQEPPEVTYREVMHTVKVLNYIDFPITGELKSKMVAVLEAQINNPSTKIRSVQGAIRELGRLERMNMDERHHREDLAAGVGQTNVSVTYDTVKIEIPGMPANDRFSGANRG